jgi:hypothetical protein
MEGKLVKIQNDWVVEKTSDKDTKLYPLCFESKKIINQLEENEQKIQNTEVIFSEIVTGEYCKNKEILIRNYFAKINEFKGDINL